MNLDEEQLYAKIIIHNMIYNFIVDKLLIQKLFRISLGVDNDMAWWFRPRGNGDALAGEGNFVWEMEAHAGKIRRAKDGK